MDKVNFETVTTVPTYIHEDGLGVRCIVKDKESNLKTSWADKTSLVIQVKQFSLFLQDKRGKLDLSHFLLMTLKIISETSVFPKINMK